MPVTAAAARAIAQWAYLFTYPLARNYARMYTQAIDPSAWSDGDGFGRWLQHRPQPSPTTLDPALVETAPHSSLWLDVRAEPWVIAIPATGPVAGHTLRIVDLWTFVIDQFDADAVGSDVLVASPTWEGRFADRVGRVVTGESAFLHLEVRLPGRAPAGQPELRPGRCCTAKPLSAHLGRPSPAPAPPVPWWPCPSDVGTTDEFWSVASFALSLTTPHPEDRILVERMAEIGLVAGRPWPARPLGPDVVEAVGEGMDEAITMLMRAASPTVDPASTDRSREDTDRDYFGRALRALRRHGTES